jgi:hypothetical protein
MLGETEKGVDLDSYLQVMQPVFVLSRYPRARSISECPTSTLTQEVADVSRLVNCPIKLKTYVALVTDHGAGHWVDIFALGMMTKKRRGQSDGGAD